MKKLLILFISLILCFNTFALNERRVYSVDDSTYSDIETLYLLCGYGLPSSSGPWTAGELLMLMEKIDKESLPNQYRKIYDRIAESLNPKVTVEKESYSLNFGALAALEGYYNSNGVESAKAYKQSLIDSGMTEAKAQEETEKLYKFGLSGFDETYFSPFDGSNGWFHDERTSVLTLSMETWAAENFYGYFELEYAAADWQYLYNKKFSHNLIPVTGSNDVYDVTGNSNDKFIFSEIFDWATPKKALVSAGGKHWDLIVGRDKLSWGSGVTGNLMLSKSFDFHSFAQFTTYHKGFQYTLLGTIYPYVNGIYGGQFVYSQDQEIEGYKSLIAHRLEFSLFDRVNLILTESCMFRDLGDDGFNLAMINPFGFMHNEFVRNNGNSLMVLEADYSPYRFVNVYGQFAIDDISFGGSDSDVPPQTGYLLGTKGTCAFGPGVLKGSVEYAVTSPYCYLRGSLQNSNYGRYTLDSEGHYVSYGYGFDAITKHFSNISGGVVMKNQLITYTYGNDVQLIDLKATYEIADLCEATLEYMHMNHGVMSIYSPWGTGKVKNDYSTPSTVDAYNSTSSGATVKKSNIFSLSGTYHTPVKGLDAYATADLVICNSDKEVQVTFGTSYEI